LVIGNQGLRKKMKKETSIIGNFVHVYNRGSREMPIVFDETDKWRFLKTLRYFNDEYSSGNILRSVKICIDSGKCNQFERPENWPPSRPLVKILAYCLMPNHFHLLLEEIREHGISKFMSRISDSFTKYINTKKNQSGRLFQGPYQFKIIKDEKYFQYVDTYIQVFNPFELYPGGVKNAVKNFDKAFDFVLEYVFSSLGESFGRRCLHILTKDKLEKTFKDLNEYKEFAREALAYHSSQIEEINSFLTHKREKPTRRVGYKK